MDPVELLDVAPGAPLGPVLATIRSRLTGGGPALVPVPGRSTGAEAAVPVEAAAGDPVLHGAAVLLHTSGSSASPRRVALPAEALLASGAATHRRLGGTGQWLLALPAHHVAGFQVLARSAQAGTEPVALDPGPFTADRFAAAVARLDPGSRRYTSLVPTQLSRLLDHPAALDALASLDAVLVGGAALPAPVRRAMEVSGVTVVTTYGMTETCGGCVYDGLPLDGMAVRLDPDGRVNLGGPAVAAGYVGLPELTTERFRADPAGVRWFRTDDLGELDGGDTGRLRVLGRVDDIINTGGHKVAPADVEAALLSLPEVRAVVVLGTPDPEWGERVGAVVVPSGEVADQGRLGHRLRESLRGTLPSHALPRQVLLVGQLPLLPSGKPDRLRLGAALAADGGRMGGQPGS
jgi:O-succinylbenzoic acid--CoA ligase